MCDFMKMIQNALPKFRVGHGFRDLTSATEDYYDDPVYNAAFTQIVALDRTTYEEYQNIEEELKKAVKLGLEKCNLFYGIDWIFSADLGEPMSKRRKFEAAPTQEHPDDSARLKRETEELEECVIVLERVVDRRLDDEMTGGPDVGVHDEGEAVNVCTTQDGCPADSTTNKKDIVIENEVRDDVEADRKTGGDVEDSKCEQEVDLSGVRVWVREEEDSAIDAHGGGTQGGGNNLRQAFSSGGLDS